MPSSTSNSNERLPQGPWAKTWITTLACTAALLGGYETFARVRGFRPGLNDDSTLWCLTRGNVRDDDRDQVVLIGGSRMQLDIDTDLFAASFNGRRPVQLAVSGSSCIPVLHDLSMDTGFRGLVVCDVHPTFFFTGVSLHEGPQAEYVREYGQRTAAAPLEWSLRLWTQRSFAFRQPQFIPGVNCMRDWIRHGGRPPPPEDYLVMLPDRSKRADYSKVGRVSLSAAATGPPRPGRSRSYGISSDGFARDVCQIAEMVRKIQDRGGRVVFVKLPVSGALLTFEQKRFPRQRYWDVLSASTGATMIHYEDYPELAGFSCPDGSHLDCRDTTAFTAAFTRILHQHLGDMAVAVRPTAPPGS